MHELRNILGQIHDTFPNRESPAFRALAAFLKHPVQSTTALFEFLKTRSLSDVLGRAVADAKACLVRNSVTLETLAIFALLFIVCYGLVKHVQTDLLSRSDAKLFKSRVLGTVYLGLWAVMGVFACDLVWNSMKKFPGGLTLGNLRVLALSTAIALVAVLVLVLALAFMHEALLLIPVLGTGGLLYTHFSHGFGGPYLYGTACALALMFLVGLFTRLYFKASVDSLRGAARLVLGNAVPIFACIALVTVANYFAIGITVSLWKLTPLNSSTYFFILFMGAWAYFTASYLLTVFTASLLANSPGFAVRNTLDSFDFICFCSLAAAFFQTLVVLLDTAVIALGNYTNLVLKAASYALYLLARLFRVLLVLVDFNNTAELTSVGVLGIDGYLANKKSSEASNGSGGFSLPQMLLASLEGTPYLLLSLLSVSTFGFYFANARFLLFSLFFASNVFLGFLNAIFIGLRAHCVKQKN